MSTAPLKELHDAPFRAAYHLVVDADEVRIARRALQDLITNQAHEWEIRRLARGVLERLLPGLQGKSVLSVPLSAEEMKISHTAIKLAFDDTRREQSSERTILRELLKKLPDEHAIRAIRLL
jgi:hypothetical protein